MAFGSPHQSRLVNHFPGCLKPQKKCKKIPILATPGYQRSYSRATPPSASKINRLAHTDFRSVVLAFIEVRADTFGGMEFASASCRIFPKLQAGQCFCSTYLHLGPVDTTRKNEREEIL